MRREAHVDQRNERAPAGPRSLPTVTHVPGAVGFASRTIQQRSVLSAQPGPYSRSKDMSVTAATARSLASNLNQLGSYLHWSIFTVSVANLALIAVMVVIFGAALLLPFPTGKTRPAGQSEADPATGESQSGPASPAAEARLAQSAVEDEDARMWTARVRRRAVRLLPPGKLLPDRQPAYVASWAYVFGVASLAALGVAIGSGFALALGGPDWWHYNPVGHFFNSLHLWSVELFMALLVIHLWAKFWMAAWRGRRAMTWITGVVAFLASIVECFTGYLSQQNFDSQWISTSGKDAFNSVGVGAFFNVMNFGQMLMWHIVLIPIILLAVVGAHVLMVRVRGVAHPIGDAGAGRTRAIAPAGGRGRGCRRMARPDPPLRHPEGGHDRLGGGAGADLPAGRPPVLARRAAGHHRHLGAGRSGRLPGHRGQRTQRDQRDGDLRPALQQPVGQRAAPAVLAADLVRRHPAGQRGAGFRDRSANHARAHRPGRRRAAARIPGGFRRPAAEVGQRLRDRGDQGQVRRREPGGPEGGRRAGSGDDGRRAHPGAQRRPGHRPARPAAVLRHQLHQPAAVHRGRPVLRRTRPRP